MAGRKILSNKIPSDRARLARGDDAVGEKSQLSFIQNKNSYIGGGGGEKRPEAAAAAAV